MSGSLLMQFANDFHLWLRHSWKLLANRLIRDPKIVFHGNSCIIPYIIPRNCIVLPNIRLGYIPTLTSHEHYGFVFQLTTNKSSGPWFNIKMSSYQYRKSYCGGKTVVRSSYLHNRISYTGKMSSLYWIGAQISSLGALLKYILFEMILHLFLNIL